MPGYGRHFSSSRYGPRGHSRTKRGWFCLVPSKLDPRSAQCSTTAEPWGICDDQPRPFNVIPGISRRWTRPGSVWIQCASAHCLHNARQRCWRPGVGLCWRPRRPVSNVNSAQQCPKEESASSITVLLAQSPVVVPRHPDAPHRHNARSGYWAREAKPRRCQQEAAPTVHRAHCGIDRGTAAYKTGFAFYTLPSRARGTDAARSQPPALERHRAQSHSRTKRGWFCLVPSKLDPRSARCSTTAGPWGICDDQPQPSNVILGSPRLRARSASVATQYLRAHCPPTSCKQRRSPSIGLGWRPRRPAANTNYAQHCPKEEIASPTTVLQAQSILVAPRHPSASHRHNAQGGHWAHKAKLRYCRHSATPIVRLTHQCSNKGTAVLITVFQTQPTLVAPRHPDAAHRHNAQGGHWAHKGRLRRCQQGATLIVHRARRGLDKETAAHKTGFAPHTLPSRARGTDTALPQHSALGRHRAQSHSRTKKASYARCNPGHFPGQAALSDPCPGLATTTVSPRRPWLTNVAQRQRATPATGGFALPKRGTWMLCSPVRTLHSLAIPKTWSRTPWRNAAATKRRPRSFTGRPMIPTIALAQRGIWTLCSPMRTLHNLEVPKTWLGTPRRNAAIARRTPRTSAARPMIPTVVGALSQQRARQVVYSVTPRQQPWSLPREAAVVPPRRSVVLCPASRTGNLYTVPVIRCSPETLTKALHRDDCRVAHAVCAVPRARHGTRMTLDWRCEPSTARSTTARLASFHTGGAIR